MLQDDFYCAGFAFRHEGFYRCFVVAHGETVRDQAADIDFFMLEQTRR